MAKRLYSLDVFRGITVVFMIIVNNPGDWSQLYAPLEHAKWHGCTPTDLVFPFFLFIVGVSIPFANRTKQNLNTTTKYQKILIRTAKLFALGLFLSLFPKFNFETVRIMGVLQRISLVYLFCSIMYMHANKNQLVMMLLICLLVYYFLLNFVPVPSFGAANLEPATNLGAWLDRTIFTEAHLWKAAKTWDPEGLLGTIPAIGNGIIGIFTGQVLLENTVKQKAKIIWMAKMGMFAIAVGLFWDYWGFPFNKSLWTSSYVLFTSGLAILFLAFLYFVIDIKNIKPFTQPFVVFGANAILAFFLSGFIPRVFTMIKINSEISGNKISLQNWFYTSYISPYFTEPKNASLAYAMLFLFLLYIPLYALWKKRIFLKV